MPFRDDCLSLISDFNREAGLRKPFGSISRLGSGRQVKRSVKNTCCALCGDVKYTPPAHKKIAHAYKAKSRHPNRLEQTMAPAKMPTRLIIWFRKHLKVKLCDVAHVFDVTSRDFSCILPAVLLQPRKHKRVKCFRKEFRYLMRLDPQGSGNSGKGIGNQSWEVSTPTNSSTSLSSGNQVLGLSAGENNWDVAENTEKWTKSLEKQDLRMEGCERKKVPPVEWTACAPLNLGEVQHCTETSGSSMISKVQDIKASPVRHVPPLLLRRVHAFNCFASSQSFQNVDSCNNFTVSETGTYDNCLVKNGLKDGSEGEADSSDSFSCQRTTAYIACHRSSCARTCRPWPFPRHGPPSEIKVSIHTGPRWIVTTEVLEGSKNAINNTQIDFNKSSECTVGNNMNEDHIGFEPHNGSGVVPNGQAEVQSTTQNVRVLSSTTLEETSKDHPEYQKNPVKALTLVSCEGDHLKQSSNMFQQDSPNLVSAHNDAQAVDKPNVIPAGSVCTVDTKSVKLDLGDSCMNRSQSIMSCKCLENNETVTEATIFYLPDLNRDLPQSDLQSLSCIMHTREEPESPSVMILSNVEPKNSASVMVHPTKEQKDDIENRGHCSDLHTKTANKNAYSLTISGSSSCDAPLKTKSDDFSSIDEDICIPSPVQRPEEGECVLLQYEMCETGKAIRSPSPLPIALGSVVTGGDLDVVRAYEEDAIVLDVIQDDPDLFGAIGVDTAGNSASKVNPIVVQRGTNMCMKTDQTTLVKKNNRIVWDLKSRRYVDVYKQEHFLYIAKLIF